MRSITRLGAPIVFAFVMAAACSAGDEGNGSSGGGATDGGLPGLGGFGSGTGGASAVPPATCGNGTLDPGEDCEAGNLAGQSCASQTMNARPTGQLVCLGCRFDTAACQGGVGAGGSAPGAGGTTMVGAGGMIGTGNTGNTGGTVNGTGGTINGTGGTVGANGETGRMVGMTAAHNQARRSVPTSNPIPDVTWSDAIAQVAQAYADQLAARGCPMDHSYNPSYGENLAQFSGGGGGTAQQVVGMWVGESSCWIPGPFMAGDQCACADGQCGHYTQVVWRGTTEIGCGVATCVGSEVWVCNYAPPGNYVGDMVY